MDLDFLDLLAPLGKKYGKKQIAAPLIMTPKYIDESSDVFPMEFLNIKLLHYPVFGNDIFKNLEISASYLRRQCERELKARLIGLRQGYISAAGDAKSPCSGDGGIACRIHAAFQGRHRIARQGGPPNQYGNIIRAGGIIRN